jgi:2-oxoglutarate ferredoxin oxidoreductase subunit gamma
METSIIIAGFGGQGVLFAGQLLAYAALDAGKHVTWIPSYGPEMRGGTAHCTVIISQEPIGAPLVARPDIAIALNRPSAQKYAALVRQGGLLLVNTSLVEELPQPAGITVMGIAANQLAEEAGNPRAANVVMLGALLAQRPILAAESVAQAIKEHLPARHQQSLAANYQALSLGAQAVTAQKLVT